MGQFWASGQFWVAGQFWEHNGPEESCEEHLVTQCMNVVYLID